MPYIYSKVISEVIKKDALIKEGRRCPYTIGTDLYGFRTVTASSGRTSDQQIRLVRLFTETFFQFCPPTGPLSC